MFKVNGVWRRKDSGIVHAWSLFLAELKAEAAELRTF